MRKQFCSFNRIWKKKKKKKKKKERKKKRKKILVVEIAADYAKTVAGSTKSLALACWFIYLSSEQNSFNDCVSYT